MRYGPGSRGRARHLAGPYMTSVCKVGDAGISVVGASDAGGRSRVRIRSANGTGVAHAGALVTSRAPTSDISTRPRGA